MKARSLTSWLLGLLLFSSCERHEKLIPRATAEAAEKSLRSTIDENSERIGLLENELKRSEHDHDVLVTRRRELVALIGARLEALESETASANEVLQKIKAGVEEMKQEEAERDLRRARGERVDPLFCGNGPWDEWPKMAEEANTTISRNAAVRTELTVVLERLSAPTDRDNQGEQAGAGQPATRSESDSESGDKPQPEAEGRSR